MYTIGLLYPTWAGGGVGIGPHGRTAGWGGGAIYVEGVAYQWARWRLAGVRVWAAIRPTHPVGAIAYFATSPQICYTYK